MAEQEEKDTDFTYKGLFNASSQDASVVQSDKQGMTASGTDRRNPQRWLSICALVIAASALIVAVAIAISYKPDCSCHMHETPDSGIIQNFYPPLGEVLAVTRVLLLFVCPAGLECSICVSESVSEATDWSMVWEECDYRRTRRMCMFYSLYVRERDWLMKEGEMFSHIFLIQSLPFSFAFTAVKNWKGFECQTLKAWKNGPCHRSLIMR